MTIYSVSRVRLLVALLLMLTGYAASGQEINSSLFRYDRSTPLEWKNTQLKDTANCTVSEASFAVIEDHIAVSESVFQCQGAFIETHKNPFSAKATASRLKNALSPPPQCWKIITGLRTKVLSFLAMISTSAI